MAASDATLVTAMAKQALPLPCCAIAVAAVALDTAESHGASPFAALAAAALPSHDLRLFFSGESFALGAFKARLWPAPSPVPARPRAVVLPLRTAPLEATEAEEAPPPPPPPPSMHPPASEQLERRRIPGPR